MPCGSGQTGEFFPEAESFFASGSAAQAVGIFSKENAAVLPAIMLLYDLTWRKRGAWQLRAPAYAQRCGWQTEAYRGYGGVDYRQVQVCR